LRKVRIAKLPPEVSDRNIRMALRQFGEIRDIQSDTWSNNYHYLVSNGVRITTMNLVQHIPSHLIVVGHRILILYEGKPTTCFGCNEIGHLYQVCPRRRRTGAVETRAAKKSWADMATTVATGTMNTIERSDNGGRSGGEGSRGARRCRGAQHRASGVESAHNTVYDGR
jgi:hypothetical protein